MFAASKIIYVVIFFLYVLQGLNNRRGSTEIGREGSIHAKLAREVELGNSLAKKDDPEWYDVYYFVNWFLIGLGCFKVYLRRVGKSEKESFSYWLERDTLQRNYTK